jgi:hypothetical protein
MWSRSAWANVSGEINLPPSPGRIRRLHKIETTRYEFRDEQLERQFEDDLTGKKVNLRNGQR